MDHPRRQTSRTCLVWVIACLLPALHAAIAQDKFTRTRNWTEGKAHYEARLRDFASSRSVRDAGKLSELFDAYNRCRYFALVEKVDGLRDPFVDWLLAHPDFTARLLSSFAPEDAPEECLEVVRSLRSAFGSQIVDVGNLVIAFAIVWDRDIDAKASRGESFGYYYKNRKVMRSDFEKTPYELLKHIANTTVSIQERMWALKTYHARARKTAELGRIFFDVRWRPTYFVGGESKKPHLAYTLQNILKYGGVCADQAYFAANVVKSFGIPAEVFSGFGMRGGHAWIGCVKRDPTGTPYWDLGTARYSYDRYYTGYAIDPQTGKQITDHDVASDCRTWALPREKIEACKHYVELSRLVDPEVQDEKGMALVDLALKVNPRARVAWDRMAEYCKAGVAGAKKTNKMFEFLLTAFPKHPDFSFNAFGKFIEVVPRDKVKKRMSLYDALFRLYSKRPDLAVGVRQLQGKYLMEQDRTKEAFRLYRRTIARFMKHGNLVGDLAPAVADDYLAEGQPDKAIAMLEGILRYSHKPADYDPFAESSLYVRLKLKLKELYEAMGRREQAEKVAKEVEPYLRKK